MRLIAPLDTQIRNVARKRQTSLEEASRLIERTDAEREDFVRKFFDTDWNDPGLYDLILNMEGLTVEQAAQTIKAAYTARTYNGAATA